MPASFIDIHELTQLIGLKGRSPHLSSISGGSINQAYKVETDREIVFVKQNSSSQFPGMFEAEQKGLELLREFSLLRVPEVKGTYMSEGKTFLVLEYIEPGGRNKGFWKSFGTGLARLHVSHGKLFGLDHANYIGSLPQKNTRMERWEDFFIEMRIEPQLKKARNANLIDRILISKFEGLFKKAGEYFQMEKPALIHGDLWSGNFITDNQGDPVIIDPAVYYGHRLMDIGMSKLFGGFDKSFYEFYNEVYPLQDNWKDGAEVANLYPLLVHVNLFGSGYISQVRSILNRYA